MKTPDTLPVPAREYLRARREYLGQLGSAIVTTNHLRVAVVLAGLAVLGLVLLNLRTAGMLRNYKPLVVRIDEIGRAEPVKYGSLEYAPRDAEIRYFLIQFVTKHYSRRQATVREDYAASLYYLDARLTGATIEANRKSKAIESFLAGEGEEIDIAVRNVSIEDLRASPYKATVDFEKVYYGRSDHVESRRERFLSHFVFVVRDRIPNSIVPFNPLGLTITYFREDQAFE